MLSTKSRSLAITTLTVLWELFWPSLKSPVAKELLWLWLLVEGLFRVSSLKLPRELERNLIKKLAKLWMKTKAKMKVKIKTARTRKKKTARTKKKKMMAKPFSRGSSQPWLIRLEMLVSRVQF